MSKIENGKTDGPPARPASHETGGSPRHESNRRVADMFHHAADLLGAQEAEIFRVEAYRRAADTIRGLDRDVAEVAAQGRDALDEIPGIGPSLAAAIAEIVSTGRWRFLERLKGEVDAERLLMTIPGIGPRLARRLHEDLGIATLEQLELAAHDGRLDKAQGVGPRRARAIGSAVAEALRRFRPRMKPARAEPPTAMLLDVDREYRDKAEKGLLPKIAPKRFNPTGEAWLPILHARRGSWQFTALYSNTARAHELDRTRDWVVVYFEDDGVEGQRTIVTEKRGPLAGQRVVRGRESEMRRDHASSDEAET